MSATDLLAARALSAQAAGQNVPSPCISVCHMSPHSGLCEGCLRTLDEIGRWSRMDDLEKRDLWLQLAQRSAAQFSKEP